MDVRGDKGKVKISQLTRRDIADALMVSEIGWSGRFEEPGFLGRIFDLSDLPSTDNRFSDAAGDIWQHRVNNPYDWEDDWVFYDGRFNLLNCNDEIYLNFLCETIHPVVRSNAIEVEELLILYNSILKNDGFQLVEKTRLSGKPIFVGRYVGTSVTPGVSAAKEALIGLDASYVTRQINRMEEAIPGDPDLAIGTAKELLETCCKTILHEREIAFPKNADLPQLVKRTVKELQLTPKDIPDQAKAANTIKRLLSNLATLAQGISELRNHYGTGHGKHAKTRGLTQRHAKLAVGAASTLAVFLVETHNSER